MNPIAIFYHCLIFKDNPPVLIDNAVDVILEQMSQVKDSGLMEAASEIIVGINGGNESLLIGRMLFPEKATMIAHGLQSKAENLTIVALEKWVPAHPNWNVLYFHSKGATHTADSDYGNRVSFPWRRSMMDDLVMNWRQCVSDLDSGAEVACSHFMRHMADGTQNIAAGNFFWAKSNFLATLPSIYLRDRIKQSGIDALESRYEAEVWIGNGPRMPIVKEYRPNGGGGVP